MLVFIGFSLICVNLAVSNYRTIDICKQPFGRRLCSSLCQAISGCSVIEYSYDRLYCHVRTDPASFTSPYDVSTWATSEELEPMAKRCPENSRILTTRKGSNVCVADSNIGVSRTKMNGSMAYFLGDYNIEVIGRTSLFMRMNASGSVQIEFGQGVTYGKQITVVISSIYVLMHVCTLPRFHCLEVRRANLVEPFWNRCGFTELWFLWNHSGFMSLGKGWILERNSVIQYEGKVNIPVSIVTLRPGSKDVTLIVDVKHENHHVKVRKCNNNVSTTAPRFTRLTMTSPRETYVLCNYGLPIIGQNSVVMSFDVKSTFIFHFSQHYKTNKHDIRKLVLSFKNGKYFVDVKYCVKGPVGELEPVCKKQHVDGLEGIYDDELIVWLMWDLAGFLSLGLGWTPGENTYVEYWGNSTLPVNYLKLQSLTRKTTNVKVTVCSH